MKASKKIKKVFSAIKFIEDSEQYFTESSILTSLKRWAIECHGLTPEEMEKEHYGCSNDWLVEVEN